jgi:hypothetical protein
VDLPGQFVLRLRREQVGDEQLVDDEQQDDEAAGDEQLAEGAGDQPERLTARPRGPG